MAPVGSVIWALSPGSSDVDWCEPNYNVTDYIAEFWNTMSNVLFFLIPPVLIALFRPYSVRVKWGVNVVWLLLVIIGLGSVYFHSTLSLVGQLLDEIAIIWVVLAAMCIWYPKAYFPKICRGNRSWWQRGVMACAVLSTILACVWPAINCIALFILGVPATHLLVAAIIKAESQRCYDLGCRTGLTWVLALVSWAADHFFCDLWTSLSFPYMHCFWHVFVFLASYSACVLFAYMDAVREVPEMKPELRFWPLDNWPVLGIPYVALKAVDAVDKNANLQKQK